MSNKLRCPHCNETNVVAGYFTPPYRNKQRTDGITVTKIYCGFCGKEFTPPKDNERVSR